MHTFDVSTAQSFLGAVKLTAGDTRLYRADFRELLDKGVTVSASTLSVTSLVSTVSGPTLSPDKKSVEFYVYANSAAEVFTLNLQIVDTESQTLNFTVIYNIYTPTSAVSSLGPVASIIGPTGPTGPTFSTGAPGVTGSKSGNAALANLCTVLAAAGIITDNTI